MNIRIPHSPALYTLLILIPITFLSCNIVDSNENPFDNNDDKIGDSEWLIPANEIIDGGPGQDGIPSIDEPKFIHMYQADFIEDDRLVLGIKNGDKVRLYPHQILDWHEIVNDNFNDESIALTYCPLTGTGIAFKRRINNIETKFGVSGLLFRNNLIMYDRNTDSRWSQMQMRSVNGELIGHEGTVIQTIQTDWKTWKKLYSDARVLSTETGFSRDYNSFAYGESYLNNDDVFIFEPKRHDDRLPNKAQVHAVFPDNFEEESTAPRIFALDSFGDSTQVIRESFDNRSLLTVGNTALNFTVSFYTDPSINFEAVQNKLPVIMQDDEGNKWDIFGEAISGPKAGSNLTPTTSYNGYWFAFADFYPNSCIYPNISCL